MMRTRVGGVVGLVLALGMATGAGAEEPFFLKDGDKVVFFGDSITQAGHYVTYVEAFLMTRFPDQSFSVINHGISSETVSGTTEPGQGSKRPNALDRFERDVLNYEPDVLCACFGMNDGIYAPFDEERFGLYQKGIRTLVDGVREQGGRVVLLTPPPFDPYRRKASDPDAKDFGYKYPYLGYDNVLGRYGRWERSLRSEGVTVADVHSLFLAHLEKRRAKQVSYYLSGDAVHPNETGHWLMAEAVLSAWNAPEEVDEVTLDVGSGSKPPESETVKAVGKNGAVAYYSWTSRIPMPVSPKWDEESLELERVSERLNRYRLTVTGLENPDAEYRLMAAFEDEPLVEVARLTGKELAEGVDLNTLEDFPTVKLSREILERLETRNRQIYQAWRKAIADGETRPLEPRPDEELKAMCKPRVVKLSFEKAVGKR